MKDKFIFAGNRFFVLDEMIKMKLNIVKIFTVKNSYLHKELKNRKINYEIIKNQNQLITKLKKANFDIFISNGCPIILPISKIKKKNQKFINIHPSYLPDLRGKDPHPGALLNARDTGVTCHIMSDTVDTGKIISQKKISYSQELDVALLYRLSFILEKEVFKTAYIKKFKPQKRQILKGNEINFSIKEYHLKIDFNQNANNVYQKIKAFSNRSRGAYFIFKKMIFRVYDCEIVGNRIFRQKFKNSRISEVILKYENKLIVKLKDKFIKLKDFNTNIDNINEGSILQI